MQIVAIGERTEPPLHYSSWSKFALELLSLSLSSTSMAAALLLLLLLLLLLGVEEETLPPLPTSAVVVDAADWRTSLVVVTDAFVVIHTRPWNEVLRQSYFMWSCCYHLRWRRRSHHRAIIDSCRFGNSLLK